VTDAFGGEGWWYEALIERSKKGDTTYSASLLAEYAYRLKDGRGIPPVLIEYIAEVLLEAANVEKPAHSNAVAKALNLVGKPGRKPDDFATWKKDRELSEAFERHFEQVEWTDTYGGVDELLAFVLEEAADDCKVKKRTLVRAIKRRLSEDVIWRLRRALKEKSEREIGSD